MSALIDLVLGFLELLGLVSEKRSSGIGVRTDQPDPKGHDHSPL